MAKVGKNCKQYKNFIILVLKVFFSFMDPEKILKRILSAILLALKTSC